MMATFCRYIVLLKRIINTELGTQFVLACRALENVTDETPHKEGDYCEIAKYQAQSQRKGFSKYV
jgi:hypothetical protein